MQFELTPEHVMEIGKLWGDAFLSTLSNEKKLELVKDIPVHERFKDVSIYKKLDIVKDIPVRERLKDLWGRRSGSLNLTNIIYDSRDNSIIVNKTFIIIINFIINIIAYNNIYYLHNRY